MVVVSFLSFSSFPLNTHATTPKFFQTQPPPAAFTKQQLSTPDTTAAYTFLVGGHLYGAHGSSIYPATSLILNIDKFSRSGASFFMSLGDLFRDTGNEYNIAQTEKMVRKLGIPLFNAPGNHDLSKKDRYRYLMGPLQFAFSWGPDLFIVLNSEAMMEDNWSLDLSADYAAFRQASGFAQPRNVFVFSHRLIWALADEAFAEMDGWANESAAALISKEKAEKVAAQIKEIAGESPVYWFGGDVGTEWSQAMFYEKAADKNWHYFATGLGDTEHDGLLHMLVGADGTVQPRGLSLARTNYEKLPEYNLNYWRAWFERHPRSAGGTWSRIKGVLGSRKFWLGFGFAGVLGLILLRLRRRNV